MVLETPNTVTRRKPIVINNSLIGSSERSYKLVDGATESQVQGLYQHNTGAMTIESIGEVITVDVTFFTKDNGFEVDDIILFNNETVLVLEVLTERLLDGTVHHYEVLGALDNTKDLG